MIILAIDPGIKNLGWAKYNTEKNSFIEFGKYDLTKNVDKTKTKKYAFLVKNFIDNRPDIFQSFDKICIEIQMAAKFKVIQTAFQCLFWSKSVI